MICVYKEYEVKVKMVQEQWLQIKVNFLLLFNGGGGGELICGLVEGGESTGGDFPRWGMSKFFG